MSYSGKCAQTSQNSRKKTGLGSSPCQTCPDQWPFFDGLMDDLPNRGNV